MFKVGDLITHCINGDLGIIVDPTDKWNGVYWMKTGDVTIWHLKYLRLTYDN